MECPPRPGGLAGEAGPRALARGAGAGWGAASSARAAVGGVDRSCSRWVTRRQRRSVGRVLAQGGHRQCRGRARDDTAAEWAVFSQEVAPAFPVELNEARAAGHERLTTEAAGGAEGGKVPRRAAARAFRSERWSRQRPRMRPGGLPRCGNRSRRRPESPEWAGREGVSPPRARWGRRS
ncbi:hypothetical protein ACSSS7_007083 [Eimeria intestinalis]